MASWKIGPVIACGILGQGWLPPGVISIVNGHGREVGQALVSHLGRSKVAFIGSSSRSTSVAKQIIMRAALVNLTLVTLETGGKSPLLVFEDVDLDQAAKWAYIGIIPPQKSDLHLDQQAHCTQEGGTEFSQHIQAGDRKK
ncbi:uncharacterized protein A1O9_12107 [Exophiala aquamarina CBS 119918]|uniref:Aldehyde dehydrogenase domain-containing protein n=1 Tax=Exophiala aquamarina CBS 119918 TaxID=1182545 RepID=A0A072P896_9EURO|nr:uncharacterized protein A1O9_12107 [Exophiala aquamarina CBS 119918]KEF51770.1 hypothetical protein A1O9_12107 [Exophiala aquamarina CBS 119918]